MSKRLQSTAMMSRMASVGAALDTSAIKDTKQRIYHWLDNNEDCCARLLQLMESGLVHEMLNKDEGKKLPVSCCRVGLLSATVKDMALKRANPLLTHSVLKEARKKDAKVADKLFYFACGWPKATGMQAGMGVEQFLTLFQHRCSALGDRLKDVVVGPTGEVDWERYGVYQFAHKKIDGEDPEQTRDFEAIDPRRLGPNGETGVTHVLHRFSGLAVSLESLVGVGKLAGEWTVLNNHHEELAQLSNGHRMKVDIWPDLKANEYFEYDRKVMEAFPESQCSLKIGAVAKEWAAKNTKEAKDALREAAEKAKKANLQAVVPFAAPAKKRRRAA